MPDEVIKFEVHLTPDGWVKGTRWYNGRLQGAAMERPSDAVETWTKTETKDSWDSPWSKVWVHSWNCPETTEDRRQEIRRIYPGGPPYGLDF